MTIKSDYSAQLQAAREDLRDLLDLDFRLVEDPVIYGAAVDL